MGNEKEPASQSSRSLIDLYESWGVFGFLNRTLDELPPDHLKILNIARNLLEGCSLPGVAVPRRFMGLLERGKRTEFERRYVTRRWQEPTTLPSDRITIRPIQTLSELPQVLPPNRLLQEVATDLFIYNAVTNNLPVAVPQKPRIVMEERSEKLEELIPRIVRGASPRQRVYTLMDVSTSMSAAHKLIFAKAVMMSYLIKAREEGSQIFFRAFAGTLGERIDCLNGEQFGPLARVVLGYKLYAWTAISKALQTAVADIMEMDSITSRKKAKTEILLISDCAETAAEIPDIPRAISLHTLLLTGGNEKDNFNTDELKEFYRRQFEKIKTQSRTFTEIDTSGLKLPPEVEDAWNMQQELEELEGQHKKMNLDEVERDQRFQRRVRDLSELSGAYRKMYGGGSISRVTNSRVQDLKHRISREGIRERMMEKIQQAMAIQSRVRSRLKKMKLPKKQSLAGLLFDFRIRD